MLFFLFFICNLGNLYCEEVKLPVIPGIQSSETKSILTDIGAEPSAIVAGCVNVISGDYLDHEVDLTIPAPEPFTFARNYSSSDMHDTLFFNLWHINHQGYLQFSAKRKKEGVELLMVDLGNLGARTYFQTLDPEKTTSFHAKANPLMYERGLSNIAHGVISGQNNLKNTRCLFKCKDTNKCSIKDGSGEIREYQNIIPSKKHAIDFRETNFYGDYILKNVKKPSGMSFELSHIYTSHLESVVLKNRNLIPVASLKVSHSDMHKEHGIKNYNYYVKAPDDRYVHYKLQSFGTRQGVVLKSVYRSDGPTIDYEYEDGDFHENAQTQRDGHYPRIIRKNRAEGRFLALSYYDLGKNAVQCKDQPIKIYRDSPAYNRVKEISAPLGTDGTPHVLYSFDYCALQDEVTQWGTGVYDALGNKTDYFFNRQNRLEKILKFQQGQIPYTEEEMFWGAKKTPEQICLKTRSFGAWGARNKIYARSYFYDERGNLILDALYGNITGKNPFAPLTLDTKGNIVETGPDQKVKECTYSDDGMNLLTRVKEGEITRVFAYVPGTNLPSAVYNVHSQGIFARTFCEYDANAMITKSISDDGIGLEPDNLLGVTVRKVEYIQRSSEYPVGLPLEVKKMYWDPVLGQERLARREVNHFDKQGRMIEKEVYDAYDQFAYSQTWEYNDWGNLVFEKNALGHIVTKDYDKNGNLIREEGPLLGAFKTFTYDFANRLIKSAEHHPDGILTQHFKYDLMGNKSVAIDPFGNQTDYIYDAFGRVLTEMAPQVLIEGISKRPTTSYLYDELSHPIAITDPNGNTTKTAYTLFGKPYRIEYPDGSVERFEYDLDSLPVKEFAKNGTVTLNTYDYQGRITKKEAQDAFGNTLSAQEWGYNALHLLYEKDTAGVCTNYRYDAQGRKVAIVRGASETILEYDALGRVCKTTYEGTVKVVAYDALDRMIEEREENLNGNILKTTAYAYDPLGRKIAIQYGTGAVSRCTYDTHGIPVEMIDPEGHITKGRAEYGQYYVLETVDPKGIKTAITFDSRGLPVSEETTNPFGVTLHEKMYAYDLCGNRTQIVDIPYCDGLPKEAQKQVFVYDSMHRLTASIQAAGSFQEKRLAHHYNLTGEKIETVKPDGNTIHYTYDALGRIERFLGPDFHYKYTYDAHSNPIKLSDCIQHEDTLRCYDIYKHLTHEKLQNELSVDLKYAPDGKLLALTLPDETSIAYAYQGSLLKTIERQSQNGYIHHYDAYDLEGRLLKETLVHGVGQVQYAYTPSGHLVHASSPFFSEQSTQYDPCGNLSLRTLTTPEGDLTESFAYDDLGQLTHESGLEAHSYKYDSLHNRVQKDGASYSLNLLNQLTSDENYQYTYDLGGNLVAKSGALGTTRYTYDSLDRLTKVQSTEGETAFTYDAENRCMTIGKNGSHLRLIYLAQAEIGACDADGEVIQLQIVGLGRRSEPFRAAAIELNHVSYAVIADQSGHVRALVDQEGQIAAAYQYTAFGLVFVEKGASLENPWMMAGKRYESSTGLVLFGRRFYDPEMGRWMTEDPAGYTVSPNLYAYLNNCPLAHYDAYGLFENVISQWASNFMQGAIDTAFSLGQFLIQSSGHTIHLLSWHLIPFPLIKDLPMAAGHFLKYGNLRDYTMSYREPHSYVSVHGTQDPQPGTGHVVLPGMLTTKEDREAYANKVSAAHNNERVQMANNVSHGFVQDSLEWFFRTIGISTHQSKVSAMALQRGFNDAGGVGEGHFITVDAHSRGATDLKGTFRLLPAEVKDMLYVNTLGAASFIGSGEVAHAMNYVGTRDLIPAIASPLFYWYARIFGDETVTFVPTQRAIIGHDSCGDTYDGAILHGAASFRDFLRCRR